MLTAARCRIFSQDVSRLAPEAFASREHWIVFRVDEEIVERARHRFPKAPMRTLDAIHLATAIAARAAVPGVALLSLDERIRGAARELGFTALPGTVARGAG